MEPCRLNILKFAVLVMLNVLMIGICARTGAVLPSIARPESVAVFSQRGSSGNEVRQIQERLKRWGYFSGEIDGIYGEETEEAVRYFQRKNGLQTDGIAGSATLNALGLPAAGADPSVNNADYELLARIISAEARGEPYEGQVAVGAVVLNRVEHPSFPDTVAGVVYQPGAFTAITDGQINEPITESSYRAAKDALNGWDPSGGALYYFNPDKTSNKWMHSRPVILRIGEHLFCN